MSFEHLVMLRHTLIVLVGVAMSFRVSVEDSVPLYASVIITQDLTP